METIYIRLNVRRMVFGAVLMGVLFFLSVINLFARGPHTENFVGLILFGGCAAIAIYRVNDRRAQIEINAFGYTQSGRKQRTIYWQNITSIKFDTMGRNTQVLVIKTEVSSDYIVLGDLSIDPEELYDIFYNLSILPEEKREGFVRYVKDERSRRGQF